MEERAMPKTNPLSEALRRSASPAPPSGNSAAPEPGDGTRLIGAHFPASVHRQLRAIAATEDRSMRSLVSEALNDLFAKRQLPPIA